MERQPEARSGVRTAQRTASIWELAGRRDVLGRVTRVLAATRAVPTGL